VKPPEPLVAWLSRLKARKWAKAQGRPLGRLLRIESFSGGGRYRIYELPAHGDMPDDILMVSD
jgi:hypothetical protein